MRRTTISRSELTVTAALLAAVAGSAHAQAIQRPIQQAQQAQQAQQGAGQQQQPAQPAGSRRVEITTGGAAPATGAQGETPATHTVVQGETLWAIAQQYLGDPLLWPEIYRLNTNVIEDPHWIYPGEELRITPEAAAPADSAAAPAPAPARDTAVVVQSQNVTVTPSGADTTRPAPQQGPVASPTTGPTIFSTGNTMTRRTNTYALAGQRSYRAVREGEYFSSGFLTENQPLPSGLILANYATRTVGQERTRASAQIWETLVVDPPAGETLSNGDLLLAYRRGDEVDQFGQIIHPTGLLKVTGTAGARWTAQLIRMFAPVQDGQELLKVQPFVSNTNQRAEPVVGGIEGRVLAMRDGNQVPQMQDVFFIDKGANDGVRLGDVFQLYMPRQDPEHSATLEQDQGRAIVVNTRSQTATLVIVELYRSDVGSRSLVRQVRRMPS